MFYKDDNFEIAVQEEQQLIITKICVHFFDSKSLRYLKQKQLEAITQTGYTKIFIDFQQLSVVSPQDQNWLAQDWFPEAESFGLSRFAFINSKDAFGKYALNSVKKKVKVNNLMIREFTCAESAQQWLQS